MTDAMPEGGAQLPARIDEAAADRFTALRNEARTKGDRDAAQRYDAQAQVARGADPSEFPVLAQPASEPEGEAGPPPTSVWDMTEAAMREVDGDAYLDTMAEWNLYDGPRANLERIARLSGELLSAYPRLRAKLDGAMYQGEDGQWHHFGDDPDLLRALARLAREREAPATPQQRLNTAMQTMNGPAGPGVSKEQIDMRAKEVRDLMKLALARGDRATAQRLNEEERRLYAMSGNGPVVGRDGRTF